MNQERKDFEEWCEDESVSHFPDDVYWMRMGWLARAEKARADLRKLVIELVDETDFIDSGCSVPFELLNDLCRLAGFANFDDAFDQPKGPKDEL